MKFMKFGIFVLFIVSFLSAGVTFYLSTVRENEKEKRIYLEGEKSKLESEKTVLEQQVADLEVKNQDLTEKFEKEKAAHQQALNQIRSKDMELQSLRGEAAEAQKAFENAQKRNEELERILNELETRMQQAEAQKTLSGSDVGFVNVSVTPANSGSSDPDSLNQISPEPGSKTLQSVETDQKSVTTPVTILPEPPKRRRFFPFFRSSKKEKSESPEPVVLDSIPENTLTDVTPEEKIETPEPIQEEPLPATLPQTSAQIGTTEPQKPQAMTPTKTDQTIAAGSVLLVNRKYNFIVVNLGSRQGVALDDVLSVQKEGAEAGKARVEKLYDDYCAAYIVEEQSEHPIGEGDAVTAA